MPSISSLGVGSGLDLNGLVQKLLDAERVPVENRLNQKEAGLQAELSAFGTLSSALSTLQSAVSPLKDITPGRTAVSSNPDIVEVSASDTAATGSYNVTVNQMASAHSLASNAFAAKTDVVGTGTLTFTFGTTTYDPSTDTYSGFTANANRTPVSITVDSTNNTLEGIRDTVNAADAGITAVIVNDGSGFRLLFESDDTGAENSVEVTVSDADGNDTDTSGLSQLAFNASATNLVQTVAAVDANITVNGLQVYNPSNVISTALDGLTLTLKTQSASPVAITVSQDKGAIRDAIEGFVTSYNDLVSTIDQLTSYDPDTQEAGLLLGDSLVRGLESHLRNQLVSRPDTGNQFIQTFADLGVKSNREGKLEIDDRALDNALSGNFDEVVQFLNSVSKPFDEAIQGYLGTDGLIKSRMESVQKGIDDLGEERQKLEVRLSRLQESLIRKYSALDTLLAGLQQTSTFLSQQLAKIPVPGKNSGSN